jgi:hypothetical protein
MIAASVLPQLRWPVTHWPDAERTFRAVAAALASGRVVRIEQRKTSAISTAAIRCHIQDSELRESQSRVILMPPSIVRMVVFFGVLV